MTSFTPNDIFTDTERRLLAEQIRAERALEYLQATRPGLALGVLHDFPHEEGQLQALCSDHKFRILIPGNGFGKTTVMGFDADCLLQRDDAFKPHVIPKESRPMSAIWFCQKYQQWEILRGDLEADVFTRGWTWKEQKHFYEWPKPRGCEQWPHGSRLYVLSSDSDWSSIQGVQIDAVYFDEHPDRKFWNEMMYRRRGKKKTRYMVAATMTLGLTWFVRDVIQPWEKYNRDKGRTGEESREIQDHPTTWIWDVGGIHNNPGMDQEDVEHYESIATVSEKEALVRTKGGYADFTGDPVFDLPALELIKQEDVQAGESGRLIFVPDEDDEMAKEMVMGSEGQQVGHRFGGRLDQEFFAWAPELPVESGRITIYEQPDEDEAENYVAGADFAYGLKGKDYDAIIVARKTAEGQVVQVAEAVGHWGDVFFAETCYALCTYYYVAFFCGERQVGLPTMRRLFDEMGYTYQYLNRLAEARSNRRQSDFLGHHRSAGDTIIANLRLAVKRHDVVVRSAETCQQLIRYQFRPRAKTAVMDDIEHSTDLVTGAPAGENDDLVMALAYAWHAAREKIHFKRPKPEYKEGTFGKVLRVREVLRGDTPKKDPYEIKY